jgi:hypothetical protein
VRDAKTWQDPEPNPPSCLSSNMFYGTTCQLCTSAQVQVQRKNMNQ